MTTVDALKTAGMCLEALESIPKFKDLSAEEKAQVISTIQAGQNAALATAASMKAMQIALENMKNLDPTKR